MICYHIYDLALSSFHTVTHSGLNFLKLKWLLKQVVYCNKGNKADKKDLIDIWSIGWKGIVGQGITYYYDLSKYRGSKLYQHADIRNWYDNYASHIQDVMNESLLEEIINKQNHEKRLSWIFLKFSWNRSCTQSVEDIFKSTINQTRVVLIRGSVKPGMRWHKNKFRRNSW